MMNTDLINELQDLSMGTKNMIKLIVDQYIDYIELNPGDPRSSFSITTSQYGNVEIACPIIEKWGGFENVSCSKETSVPTLVYIRYDKADRDALLSLKRSIDTQENNTFPKSKATLTPGVLAVSKDFKSMTVLHADTFTNEQAAILQYLYKQAQKGQFLVSQDEITEALHLVNTIKETFMTSREGKKHIHPLFYVLIKGTRTGHYGLRYPISPDQFTS